MLPVHTKKIKLIKLELNFQVRPRFEKEEAFDMIPLESDRMRLFREFLTTMEETCLHHHSRKKKKKDKKRRSRSRSSVSGHYLLLCGSDAL